MANSNAKYIPSLALQLILFAALGVAAFGQATAPAANPEYVYTPAAVSALISSITSGATNGDRGNAIRAELLKLKIRVTTEGFNTGGKPGTEITGTNILAEIPAETSKRLIMIGAHLDRVDKGKGAVDNASGSAVVIELLKALAARPMKNTTLKAAFWDAEERGLLGSKTWVKTRKEGDLPSIYINFDVFGYGKVLWLWTSDMKSEYATAFSALAADAKRDHSIGTDYPPSDHLSFNVPGVKSHSFSLLTTSEVAELQQMMRGQGNRDAAPPRVLQIIHTAGDVAEEVNVADIAAVLPLIESSIRVLDK